MEANQHALENTITLDKTSENHIIQMKCFYISCNTKILIILRDIDKDFINNSWKNTLFGHSVIFQQQQNHYSYL